MRVPINFSLLAEIAAKSGDELKALLSNPATISTLKDIGFIILVNYEPFITPSVSGGPLKIVEILKYLDQRTLSALLTDQDSLMLAFTDLATRIGDQEYAPILSKIEELILSDLVERKTTWADPGKFADLIISIPEARLEFFLLRVSTLSILNSFEKLALVLPRISPKKRALLLAESANELKRSASRIRAKYSDTKSVLALIPITETESRSSLSSIIHSTDDVSHAILNIILNKLSSERSEKRLSSFKAMKIKTVLAKEIMRTLCAQFNNLKEKTHSHKELKTKLEGAFNELFEKKLATLGTDSLKNEILIEIKAIFDLKSEGLSKTEIMTLLKNSSRVIAKKLQGQLLLNPLLLINLVDRGILHLQNINLNFEQLLEAFSLVLEENKSYFLELFLYRETESLIIDAESSQLSAMLKSPTALNRILKRMNSVFFTSALIERIDMHLRYSVLPEVGLSQTTNSSMDLRNLVTGLNDEIQTIILRKLDKLKIKSFISSAEDFITVASVLGPTAKQAFFGALSINTLSGFMNTTTHFKAVLTNLPKNGRAGSVAVINWDRTEKLITNLIDLRDILKLYDGQALEVVAKLSPNKLKALMWDGRKLEDTIHFINYYKRHEYNPNLHKALCFALLNAYDKYTCDRYIHSNCITLFFAGSKRNQKINASRGLCATLARNEALMPLESGELLGGSIKLTQIYHCIVELRAPVSASTATPVIAATRELEAPVVASAAGVFVR